MAWVTLSLGSNIDPINKIKSCLDALLLQFNDLSLSSVFESEAVGFEGDNFLNMVVGIETEVGIADLSKLLKDIEDKHGRDCGHCSIRKNKNCGRWTLNGMAGKFQPATNKHLL